MEIELQDQVTDPYHFPSPKLGRIINFYRKHHMALNIAVCALFAAIFGRAMHGDADLIQSSAGTGAFVGWFVSMTGGAVSVVIGAVAATFVALLAGVQGEPAMCVVATGALWGVLFRPLD